MSRFLPRTSRVWPWLASLDALALIAAAWAAHLIRFPGVVRAEKISAVLAHPWFLIVALGSLWAVAAAIELYEPFTLLRRRDIAARVWVASVGWGIGLAFSTYLVPAWQFGRGLLFLTVGLWSVLGILTRLAAGGWLRRRQRPPVLVVGDADAVEAVCRGLRHHPFAPWEPINGSKIAASEAAAEAERLNAGFVVLAGVETGDSDLAGDLASLHFSGVPVVVASEVWAWLEGRLPLDDLSPSAFLHQPGFGAVHWAMFNRLTRVADVILATLLLLIAAPVVAAACLAIVISDGRPLLYLQRRVGQFGRGFRVVKLRTMSVAAETDGPVFAAEDDPRATKIGRVLRRYRIDELPQLVNVLRGDMSLVGPRPERPEFVAELAQQIPFYTFRLAVPPGLTGWAQVNMAYARTLEEHRRRLEFDLYFIRERSFGLYVMTLLRTVATALFGSHRAT